MLVEVVGKGHGHGPALMTPFQQGRIQGVSEGCSCKGSQWYQGKPLSESRTLNFLNSLSPLLDTGGEWFSPASPPHGPVLSVKHIFTVPSMPPASYS